MSEIPRPHVRNFVVCENIVTDPGKPHRVCLMYLVTSVRATHYPALQPVLCVFAQLTECRGGGDMWVEIRRDETDEVIHATPPAAVQFPNDPLVVHGARFRLTNLVFPDPGLYWVQLRFGGTLLAQQPFTLK